MDLQLKEEILLLNPWLKGKASPILKLTEIINRKQTSELLHREWDKVWIILTGPRRSGKTTLGKILAQTLLEQKRFKHLLYLNCDYLLIRKWLESPSFIAEAIETFGLENPILFLDEVQRLESPGLLLKSIIDLNLNLKYIATGSSQLELKSKVQEFLTGRQISSLVLPLSYFEWTSKTSLEEAVIYGTYPQVVFSEKKELQLQEIYRAYIQKDIIEILKVGHSDIFQTLITLIAHNSGQIVRYEQLAIDCKISVSMIRNHLSILEQTFVLAKVSPFVGNKRSEITKSPIYYFLDNGFRNTALNLFGNMKSRSDLGFLVESFVFQELLKLKHQSFSNASIHFWRTKSGAEVDFVIKKTIDQILPIEVKYQNFNEPKISKSFHSFIEAYPCSTGIIITKNFLGKIEIKNTTIYFFPLSELGQVLNHVSNFIENKN